MKYASTEEEHLRFDFKMLGKAKKICTAQGSELF